MAPRHTLSADERLKREQSIKTLFQSGKAFSVFPLRVIFALVPRSDEPSPTRCGFSAAKKKFKKASDRNRIKRLLRESWRQRKHGANETVPEEQQLQLFILYTATELPTWTSIDEAMEKVVKKLAQPEFFSV